MKNTLLVFILVLLVSFSSINTQAISSDYFYESLTLPRDSFYMIKLEAEADTSYNLTIDVQSSNSQLDFLFLTESEFSNYNSSFTTGKTIDISSAFDFLGVDYLLLQNWSIADGESVFLVVENANYTLSTTLDDAAICTSDIEFSINISYSDIYLGIETINLRREGSDGSNNGENGDGFAVTSLIVLIPLFMVKKRKKQLK